MDWESLPTIDAGRVSLRWISEADIDALYTIFSNPEVMRYWSTPAISDRKAADLILRQVHDGFQKRAMLKWGIARRSDDALIGTVTLSNFDFDHRRAEIGYALDRAHWGRGYMQEALHSLLSLSCRRASQATGICWLPLPSTKKPATKRLSKFSSNGRRQLLGVRRPGAALVGGGPAPPVVIQ